MTPQAGTETDARATRIAEALTPSIRSAIAAELAAAPPKPVRAPASPFDREMMAACKAVGAAVDRLEQHRFAGTREAGARMQLENAAKRLRALLDRRRR